MKFHRLITLAAFAACVLVTGSAYASPSVKEVPKNDSTYHDASAPLNDTASTGDTFPAFGSDLLGSFAMHRLTDTAPASRYTVKFRPDSAAYLPLVCPKSYKLDGPASISASYRYERSSGVRQRLGDLYVKQYRRDVLTRTDETEGGGGGKRTATARSSC